MKKIIFTIILSLSMFCVNAQWKQIKGPFGGNITDMVAKDTHLFASTSGGGIFLSTNKGAKWQAINNGLTNLSVNTLAVSGNDIFAGTQGGLFFSSDDGKNWTSISVSGLYPYITDITALDSNIFFTAGSGSVYRLIRNGTTWKEVYFGTPKNGQKVQSIAINGTHICALLLFQEAYVSPINAPKWSIIEGSDQKTPLSAVAAFGNDFFMGTQRGLLMSSDNCKTWAQYSNGFNLSEINTISKKGNDFFLGTQAGIFLSKDSGQSWNALNTGLSGASISAIAFEGANIFASGQGVFHSTDYGANWTSVINGLIGTQIKSITSAGKYIFAGTNLGLFSSPDNGNTWNLSNSGLTDKAINILESDGTNIFAGISTGLFKSTNNGNTWKLLNSGLPAQPIMSLFVKGPNIFVGLIGGGLYRSTNSGDSFSPISFFNSKRINAIQTLNTTIYVAESAAHAYKSKDNGSTWTRIDSGLKYNIYCMTAIDTTVFAGSYNLIYKTSLNAPLWKAPYSDLTVSSKVSDIVASDTSIFVSLFPGGIYLCTLNAKNWIKADNGLENKMVSSLHINGTNIFAGTYGSGVWMLPLSELSEATSISKFTTNNDPDLRIFPNPGDGKITISGMNNIQSVLVADIHGKTVFSITDFSNNMSNTIDLSNLNMGIYFINITQEGKVFNYKIVIE